MPPYNKPKDEDGESSVWNDAKNYVSGKIHKWLILIDTYETLATFGYSNIESDVFIKDENLKNTSRLHALKRLIHAIKSLLRNTKFCVKGDDKDKFTDHTKRLDKIEKNTTKLRLEKKRGQRIVELNINEELFDKMMGEIHNMVDDINLKLNKAGLIFSQFEELDLKKLKENLEKEFTE